MNEQPPTIHRDKPESREIDQDELPRLRNECDRLRRERDRAQQELDQLRDSAERQGSAELKLLANNLSREIRQEFMESVKRGLWIVAILASVATAGGIVTLSDILRSRIEAAVEGKHKEIEELRKGLVGALVDVKVQATTALKEVEALKVETAKAFEKHALQVASESESALSHIRGLDAQMTASVDAAGRQVTTLSAKAKSITVQGPQSKSQDDLWFGPLSAGVLGIAGGGFNQFSTEETVDGGKRGAFSYWFQKSFQDSNADRDGNGLISFDEAVRYAASHLKNQNPVLVGEDKNITLFSTRNICERERPKRVIHAVLVGINHYKGDTNLDLEGPVPDVLAFAKLLQDRTHLQAADVKVNTLLDEKATGEAINAALNRAVDAASVDDLIVFYFSGHRTQVPDVSLSGNGKIMALVSYNFKDGSLLLVPEITQKLARSKAKQKVIIADV